MQFFSVLDADGELAREKDAHMTGNPDSDSDSEGQREGEERAAACRGTDLLQARALSI